MKYVEGVRPDGEAPRQRHLEAHADPLLWAN